MSKLNNIEKEKIRDQNKEQNKEKRAIKKDIIIMSPLFVPLQFA